MLALCCRWPAVRPVADLSHQVVTLDNGIVGTLNQAGRRRQRPRRPWRSTASVASREVVAMYARLADALAARWPARCIDFQGFGKSDGDTGSTTVTSQVADAEVAYQYLGR